MDLKKIMVCVTQQKQCTRLIHRAHELKQHEDDELLVIHVVKEHWRYFSELEEPDALEYLFEQAKAYGAGLTVLKSTEIEDQLAKFAKKEAVDVIVMGESLEETNQQNMINRLQSKIDKAIHFEIVPQEYDI